MAESESGSDLYGTLVAILIALVTVAGAIVAWRVSVALSDASTADTLGILAAVEKEDVTTRATITVNGHMAAYMAFIRDDALASAYSELADEHADRTDLANFASASRLAANYARDGIPAEYFDRDEKLDKQRDLGENMAEYSINKDTDPSSHFTTADGSRQKANYLLLNLILFGIALVLLTVADAVQNFLRYLFLLGAVGSFALGALIVVAIEIFNLH